MASRAEATTAAARAARPPAASGSPASLFTNLRQIAHELPGLVSDRVLLLSLELRRAKLALVEIVALLAVAALLGLTAWVTLWIGLIAAVIDAGLAWPWAVFGAVVLNLVAAFFAVKRARSLTHLLSLPATVRHLTLASRTEPAAPDAP